jgi:hypothetical protein
MNRHEGDNYRQVELDRLRNVFEDEHGSLPGTAEELALWAGSVAGGNRLYRRRQVEKIYGLFEDFHGRSPASGEELERWAASAAGQRYLAAFHDWHGTLIPD